MSNTILSKHRIIDPLLTNIARGYSNDMFIGENICPTVSVKKESGKIPLFGKEMFRIYETQRSLRADSNQISGIDLVLTSYSCEEHDLMRPIDDREDAEAYMNLKLQATEQTVEGLKLKKEKRIADLVQDLNTYPTGNKAELTTNQFTDTDINPAEIIRDASSDLSKIIGKRPNIMITNQEVIDNLLYHPKLIALIQNAQVGVMTMELLQRILNIPKIVVGTALYTDDDSTFKNVWGDNVLLAYVTPPRGIDRNVYEPCFAYTLQYDKYPYTDKFYDPKKKSEFVRTTDLYDIKVVGAESGYLLKDVLG